MRPLAHHRGGLAIMNAELPLGTALRPSPRHRGRNTYKGIDISPDSLDLARRGSRHSRLGAHYSTSQSTFSPLLSNSSAIMDVTKAQSEPQVFQDENPQKQVPIVEKTDYSGAHEKTDPKEIALVRKLDKWIMVSSTFRLLNH